MGEGTIFEQLTAALVTYLIGVIDKLPDSPFLFLEEWTAPASVVMSYVNWFIDFPTIVRIATTWVLSCLGWYIYRMIFKWVHLAG